MASQCSKRAFVGSNNYGATYTEGKLTVSRIDRFPDVTVVQCWAPSEAGRQSYDECCGMRRLRSSR